MNSTKKLDERKFELTLVPADPQARARQDRARMEAQSIRDEARDAALRQAS